MKIVYIPTPELLAEFVELMRTQTQRDRAKNLVNIWRTRTGDRPIRVYVRFGTTTEVIWDADSKPITIGQVTRSKAQKLTEGLEAYSDKDF